MYINTIFLLNIFLTPKTKEMPENDGIELENEQINKNKIILYFM